MNKISIRIVSGCNFCNCLQLCKLCLICVFVFKLNALMGFERLINLQIFEIGTLEVYPYFDFYVSETNVLSVYFEL